MQMQLSEWGSTQAMEDLLNGKETKTKNTLEYRLDHICSYFCLYFDQCDHVSRKEKTECIQSN